MIHRTPIIIVFVLLSCATCFGQSSYKGLTPGKSTRADVERVLGPPVKKVSETLIEYPAQRLTRQIFVQYQNSPQVVSRIEIFCRTENSTCYDLMNSVNLHLPPQPTTSHTNKGKLEEYFSATNVVLTYSDAATRSGLSQVGYYSRELFEIAVSKKTSASGSSNSNPNSGENSNVDDEGETETPPSPSVMTIRGGVLNERAISKPDPAYPAMAKATRASGIVTVQVVVDESGSVISATAVSGHPLLRPAAVAAARQARFSVTMLSGKPVSVSGVLTYNFVPE